MSTSTPADPKQLRDQMRAKALSSVHAQRVTVPYNGTVIELRQQSLKVVLASRPNDDKMSNAERSVRSFIDHAFVPGTDLRVFEEGDIETLVNTPFNKEWLDIQAKIAELAGIRQSDVDTAEKELQRDPLEGQS